MRSPLFVHAPPDGCRLKCILYEHTTMHCSNMALFCSKWTVPAFPTKMERWFKSVFILTCLKAVLSNNTSEDFSEELFIKPLINGYVYDSFQFTTTVPNSILSRKYFVYRPVQEFTFWVRARNTDYCFIVDSTLVVL